MAAMLDELTMDPYDIRHVGRRNNTIYLFWEMKSIVMLKYFIVVFQHGATSQGSIEANEETSVIVLQHGSNDVA